MEKKQKNPKNPQFKLWSLTSGDITAKFCEIF